MDDFFMIFVYGFLLVLIWLNLRIWLHILGIWRIKRDWLCLAASWLFDRVEVLIWRCFHLDG